MPLTDIRRDAKAQRLIAEDRLGASLAVSAELDKDRRCAAPTLNLVPAVVPFWATVSEQLGGGNGGELECTGGRRPKFCSAFSSCALAVNSFGIFAGQDGPSLQFPVAGSFAGPVHFEAQRSAGTRGYKPNLDVVAEPDGADWLFVESKCLEYLRVHTTAFSDAFVSKAERLLPTATADAYARFKADRDGYQVLDAAQLLKHFLAAKIAAARQRRVTLAYVYWEPVDADQYRVFAAHRAEAERLAASLVDDQAQMIAVSYPQLWAYWDSLGDRELSGHVKALRDRYAVTLAPTASTP